MITLRTLNFEPAGQRGRGTSSITGHCGCMKQAVPGGTGADSFLGLRAALLRIGAGMVTLRCPPLRRWTVAMQITRVNAVRVAGPEEAWQNWRSR